MYVEVVEYLFLFFCVFFFLHSILYRLYTIVCYFRQKKIVNNNLKKYVFGFFV